MLRDLRGLSTLQLRVGGEERQPGFRPNAEPKPLPAIGEQQPAALPVMGEHLWKQARPATRQRRGETRLERLHRRTDLQPGQPAAERCLPDRPHGLSWTRSSRPVNSTYPATQGSTSRSRVKKSQSVIPAACWRRNSRQLTLARLGAGSMQ
jgi:hypothetical protein